MVKSLPDNAGDMRDPDLIPGLEDSLEEEMVTCSVFLPGESHGKESGGLQSM